MILEKAVREPVSTPIAVEKLLGEGIRRADRERLIVLLLNSKYCLVKKETVSIGSLNDALPHTGEVSLSVSPSTIDRIISASKKRGMI
jgi:DNA repair protein RadC